MWDFFFAFIAKLLGRRDDNTIPPAPELEAGAPDAVEDDKSTPLTADAETPRDGTSESEKSTKPPFVPPPPTILPPGIKPPEVEIASPTEPPEPTVEPVSAGITTVGAWAGSRSLANPQRYVDFAAEHGINRLDIVVNDHSKWRGPSEFTIRNVKKIWVLAELAHQAGIEVHLMSWIMPHEKYIVKAAETLIPLAKATHAASIQWDAEEPWMLAKRHGGYKHAGKLVGEAFKDLAIPMGVNGIGYASVKKLKPLSDVCDYVVPQIYSTRTTGLDPKTAPAKFHKRWDRCFGKRIVVGLAAYRQSGIEGYENETDAMQAAVNATRQLKGVDTIIYWSLYHITKNKAVAKVIAGIRERRFDAPVA